MAAFLLLVVVGFGMYMWMKKPTHSTHMHGKTSNSAQYTAPNTQPNIQNVTAPNAQVQNAIALAAYTKKPVRLFNSPTTSIVPGKNPDGHLYNVILNPDGSLPGADASYNGTWMIISTADSNVYMIADARLPLPLPGINPPLYGYLSGGNFDDWNAYVDMTPSSPQSLLDNSSAPNTYKWHISQNPNSSSPNDYLFQNVQYGSYLAVDPTGSTTGVHTYPTYQTSATLISAKLT